MIPIWIMKALLVQYVAIVIFAAIAKQPLIFWYWLGACVLHSAVLRMAIRVYGESSS